MTSGQHQDINFPQLTLEQWWQVAEAKTGSFFSLACRSGAQLGTADGEKVAALGDFGFHLGLMLQIHDDIEDLQLLMAGGVSEISNNIRKSLTFSYAVEVLPEPEKNQLQELIASNSDKQDQINQMIDLFDQSGSGLYLLAELERNYVSGVKSLERAEPLLPAADDLMAMIGGLKLN